MQHLWFLVNHSRWWHYHIEQLRLFLGHWAIFWSMSDKLKFPQRKRKLITVSSLQVSTLLVFCLQITTTPSTCTPKLKESCVYNCVLETDPSHCLSCAIAANNRLRHKCHTLRSTCGHTNGQLNANKYC